MEDIQFNKKLVVLIGAGGLGRELFSWVNQSDYFVQKYKIAGFFDDNLEKLKGFKNYGTVLRKIENNAFLDYSHFIISIANLAFKKQIYDLLESINKEIVGFLHPSLLIGLNVKVSPCLVTLPNVIISCDTTIGKCVFINNGSQIGHDVIIGNYVNIMANVDIGGNCEIGDLVTIGTGATILPGIKIPNNTFIGAGSVVFRNIKEPGTYVGNPAKKIF